MKRFPRVIQVRQLFDDEHISDLDGHIKEKLSEWSSRGIDLNGKEIAITAGSRGITDIKAILFSLITFLKRQGAKPFLIPAMGSHGGASVEGQRKILNKYGITESSLGVPVHHSMDVIKVGETSTGLPVYCAKSAVTSQGLVVVNRIKDHTDFEGNYESGLVKMLVIGLGKHKGALSVHSLGIRGLKEELARCAEVVLKETPVLFGMGIVENAYGRTAALEVLDRSEILEHEPRLLAKAKRLRARIFVDELDVLIVEEMGKNISGTGMDTNVIGRRSIHGEPEPVTPKIKRIVALSLSDGSYGNAVGIGLADICTKRLLNKIDYETTYVNIITATCVERVKIPLAAETDQEAVEIALNTCWIGDWNKIRMGIIRNTRALDNVWFSEGMIPELHDRKDLRIIGSPTELSFDGEGNLVL